MKDIQKEMNEIKNKLAKPEELGTKCSIYSRITGYYRDVNNFNDGKAAEFKERKSYNF